MFKLWQTKRLMVNPAWNTPMLRTHDGTLNDARICAIYTKNPMTGDGTVLVENFVFGELSLPKYDFPMNTFFIQKKPNKIHIVDVSIDI